MARFSSQRMSDKHRDNAEFASGAEFSARVAHMFCFLYDFRLFLLCFLIRKDDSKCPE